MILRNADKNSQLCFDYMPALMVVVFLWTMTLDDRGLEIESTIKVQILFSLTLCCSVLLLSFSYLVSVTSSFGWEVILFRCSVLYQELLCWFAVFCFHESESVESYVCSILLLEEFLPQNLVSFHVAIISSLIITVLGAGGVATQARLKDASRQEPRPVLAKLLLQLIRATMAELQPITVHLAIHSCFSTKAYAKQLLSLEPKA